MKKYIPLKNKKAQPTKKLKESRGPRNAGGGGGA